VLASITSTCVTGEPGKPYASRRTSPARTTRSGEKLLQAKGAPMVAALELVQHFGSVTAAKQAERKPNA